MTRKQSEAKRRMKALESRRESLLQYFCSGWLDVETAREIGRIDGELAFLKHAEGI